MATRAPSEAVLKGLVDAALRGDAGATAQLVQATWESTYALAFKLAGNEHDALDVTQEAYLRALRGLSRFRGEARFSTWLYRVTANCASDNLSRRRRACHDELDPDSARFADSADLADRRPEHDPEAFASSIDERSALAEALLRLPRKLREVVVLRDVYDLPHRSIAAELGTSEAATKVRLQRARKRLREDLLRYWQEQDASQPSRRRRAVSRQRRLYASGEEADGTPLASRRVVAKDVDAVAS